MNCHTVSWKVVLYQGCKVVRRKFVEKFYNRTKKGGPGMDVHTQISFTPYDQNGIYLESTNGCLLRDAKRTIDHHLNREREIEEEEEVEVEDDECVDCQGTGIFAQKDWNSDTIYCDECGGSGRIEIEEKKAEEKGGSDWVEVGKKVEGFW